MKKFVIVFLTILFLTSCKYDVLKSRIVEIHIPEHPWESDGIKLWYYLKWNCNGRVETLYIDNSTRDVKIAVPLNSTVFICAYPLGEMLPFGSAVLPTDKKSDIDLSQSEGYLAHLFLNCDLEAAGHVNFKLLMETVESKTYDSRLINDSTLIADVINGCLSEDSVEIGSWIKISSISVPNGKWISEWEADGVLEALDSRLESFEIPAGVYRYYCRDLDRELRVVAESDGSVFHSLRYGMIGL